MLALPDARGGFPFQSPAGLVGELVDQDQTGQVEHTGRKGCRDDMAFRPNAGRTCLACRYSYFVSDVLLIRGVHGARATPLKAPLAPICVSTY